MPSTPNSTNSYNTIAELDDYLDDSLRGGLTWEATDPDTKARAAITATRLIDRLTYEGTKTSAVQDLEFPRDGLTDKYGDALPDATTPEEVLDAHAELTLELVLDSELEARISTAEGQTFKRVKAGSVELENFLPGAFVSITRFPSRIQNLLAPFVAGADVALSENIGDSSAASQFDDCDEYGTTFP